MEALVKAISEGSNLSELRKQGLPVNIWGLTRCSRPLFMEGLRGDNRFSLIVTYDRTRAEKLFKDYRFFEKDVYLYPAKDALFYYADVHGNLTSARRLEIIKRIYKNERTVVITTIDGLMDRLPDMKYFKRHAFSLAVGQEAELDKIKEHLVMLGYENVGVVDASGQFSVRGGILDIYPLTEECPCRVEFFGDEVDSIRYFDVSTQRSIEKIDHFEVFPSSEYVLSAARIRRGIDEIEAESEKVAQAFKKSFQTENYARIRSYIKHVKEEVMEYNSTSGLDSFVTYFFSDTVSFLDYLPDDTPIFVDEPARVLERAKAHSNEFVVSMKARLESGYILPGQANVLFDNKDIIDRLGKRYTYLFSDFYRKETEWNESREVEFDLLKNARNKGLYTLLCELNKLYAENPAFYEDEYEPGQFEWLHCEQDGRVLFVMKRNVKKVVLL